MSANSHIVLIDDDAITNIVNRKIINFNFPTVRVSTYTDATRALNQLQQWAETNVKELPDFIFLDINMPVMDGWEFLDEFATLPPTAQQKTKVVMLTSSIDIHDITKAKTYKLVTDFLSKPLDKDYLKTLMRPEAA